MPGRKGKTQQITDVGNPTEETPVLPIDQPSQPTVHPEVSDRLARIEAVLERLSAPTPPAQDSPPQMVTRGRPRGKGKAATKTTRRSVSLDPVTTREVPSCSHSNFTAAENFHAAAAGRPVSDAIPDVRPSQAAARQNVDLVTQSRADPLLNVNKPPPPQQLIDVGAASSWASWTQPPYVHQPQPQYRPQPVLNQPYTHYDPDDVEQRVYDILATTASTLSRGNLRQGPYPYPFKYVLRGTERQRVGINSVSLPEHLWGIVRMIRDDKLDPQLRPYLNTHLCEVIEDSCDFDWFNVRRWSEEVFGLIAEDRLPGGWAASPRIQMLRMSISRLRIGTQYNNKDSNYRDLNKKTPPLQAHTNELRGGPCQAYNSPAGCNLQSGHVQNGRKQQHVCTFCLFNSCAAYTHPETQCRNKTKFPPPHF